MYIEFSKTLFLENNTKSKETKSVSIWVFGEILKLCHPIMPFITEKLWSILFDDEKFLMNSLFGQIKIQNNFILSQNNFKDLTQIISSIRNLRSELNISYKNKIKLNINNSNKEFCIFLKSSENEIIRLLKLSAFSINNLNISNEGAANLVIGNSTIIIPLLDIIDTKSEINKLIQKKNKESIELEKIINRLNNKSFINNAPQEIINQFMTIRGEY